MTVKYKEPLLDNLSIKEMAMYDSKTNILETFRIINIKVSKSYTKAQLSDVLEYVFTNEPALFANILPREERAILAELLMHQQDHYVEHPRDDYHYLLLQKLHLVITYEDKNTWRFYMPDNIRQRLNHMFDEDIKLYPDLDKLNTLLNQAIKIRERVFEILYTQDPEQLGKSERKKIKSEAEKMIQDFSSIRSQLKELEPRVKKLSNVDFDKFEDDFTTIEMYLSLISSVVLLKKKTV